MGKCRLLGLKSLLWGFSEAHTTSNVQVFKQINFALKQSKAIGLLTLPPSTHNINKQRIFSSYIHYEIN